VVLHWFFYTPIFSKVMECCFHLDSFPISIAPKAFGSQLTDFPNPDLACGEKVT